MAARSIGVFGKLPARRDYVQHGVDPRLMQVFDPWLQAAVAESRRVLGEAWLDNWLLSPIWRFWLGSRIAGRPVLGALMPSVDGIGRYFPLCVLGAFDEPVPPPEIDEQAEWFAVVETLLLAALGEEGTHAALIAGVEALPPPRPGLVPIPVQAEDRASVGSAFAALRQPETMAFYERCTCWWVPSPEGAGPPRALLRRGLPSPFDYAAMVALDGNPGLSPDASRKALGQAP